MSVKVGVSIFGHLFPMSALVDLGVSAEAAGAESVWVGEYHRNPWVLGSLIASRTQRVTIGTSIALAFVRSPLVTALAALDLDEAAEQRFVLGLGPQVRRGIENWHGMAYPDKPARRMAEFVEATRTSMRTHLPDPQTYVGDYHRIDLTGFNRHPAPAREVPVHVAAVREGMIRMAQQVAAGVIGHIFWSRRYVQDVVTPLLEGVRDDFERSVTVLCSVQEDPGLARIDAKRTLAHYASTRTYRDILAADGFGSAADDCRDAVRAADHEAMVRAVPDAMLDTYAIAGPPDELHDRLAAVAGHMDRAILVPAYIGTPMARAEQAYTTMFAALRSRGGTT